MSGTAHDDVPVRADRAVSAGLLRACMSRFATGVTVVTYQGPDGPRGCTMNSFTSVSADPPLVLVSVARTARAHDALIEAPFCVNVLGAEQQDQALLFAGAPTVAAPRWHPVGEQADEAAVPRLAHPLAWVRCLPWSHHREGDHTLVVGRVVALGHRDGDALAYAWSRFTSVREARLGVEYLL